MKQLFKIFAMAAVAFTVAATTGCDVDADFDDGRILVIDNISVHPDDWKPMRFDDGSFYCLYADKTIRELTRNVINNGGYDTYFKYISMDDREPVQAKLPHQEDYLEIDGYKWHYTLDAEYSEGNLRILWRPDDFERFNPTDTFYFRLEIRY